jgi:hypothetical protein
MSGTIFGTILRTAAVRLTLAAAPRRRDRGAHTVEIMLWVMVMIVVVGGVGSIFRTSIRDFFNGLVYDIGFR